MERRWWAVWGLEKRQEGEFFRCSYWLPCILDSMLQKPPTWNSQQRRRNAKESLSLAKVKGKEDLRKWVSVLHPPPSRHQAKPPLWHSFSKAELGADSTTSPCIALEHRQQALGHHLEVVSMPEQSANPFPAWQQQVALQFSYQVLLTGPASWSWA